MTFEVELFPPGWLGRGFQLLTLSIDPSGVEDVRQRSVVFRSYEDYQDTVARVWDVARSLFDAGLVYAPRFFGGDWKPLESILGMKITRWSDAAELLVKKLEEGQFPKNKRLALTAAIMMKLNMFEYPRRMIGGRRSKEISEIDVHGYLLALVGGLLSKIGRIGDTGFYLVPPPEAGIHDLESISELYFMLALPEEGTKLSPLGSVFRLRRLDKLPVSTDVLLLLYGSATISEPLDLEPGTACGAFELNLLYAVSVSEAGNRAILNTMFPLGFSEPLCMLGSRPLVEFASTLLRALRGRICAGGEDNPGSRALSQCLQKLYLYIATGNNVYLYDCARLLRGAAESSECRNSKDELARLAGRLSRARGREVLIGG
ncbi:MAG TPA: hypothetical protein EYP33_07610 [Pyrodictium sp.]|nr:hypothetical protein [Pyrodictium sp.]